MIFIRPLLLTYQYMPHKVLCIQMLMLLHPIWRNEIDMDRSFVLPMGWNWLEMYMWLLPNEIWPYLGRSYTSKQSEIVEVQNLSLSGHFPKSDFALWQVRINNCIFFSILTDCSNNAPSNPYIDQALSACTCPWGPVAKRYCWSRGSDSCRHQPHPPEACCHRNFGARQVHGGFSEDHTSSRRYFVQDGPTVFRPWQRGWRILWNEGWPENHKKQLLSHGYSAYKPTWQCPIGSMSSSVTIPDSNFI